MGKPWFFWRVPNSQLTNYFEVNGVDPGIDFTELKEKDFDALFNAFTGLAPGLQAVIEADFHNNAAL